MKTTKADRNVWRRIAERRPERPIAFVTEDALHLLDDADRAEQLEALLRDSKDLFEGWLESGWGDDNFTRIVNRIDKELADGAE